MVTGADVVMFRSLAGPGDRAARNHSVGFLFQTLGAFKPDFGPSAKRITHEVAEAYADV
jgi:hypothetical protein